MSTKTSMKRIALVAVAALGFGMVSTVAANAVADAAVTGLAVSTNAAYTKGTAPVPAGTAITFDLKITTTSVLIYDSGTAVFTVKAGADGTQKDITSTCTFAVATPSDTDLTSAISSAATGSFTYSAAGTVTDGTYTIGTASCPTPIGGVYKVTNTGTINDATGTVATADDEAGVFTPTAPTTKATGYVDVSGANIVTGTIRNTTSGQAAVGGTATVDFTAPTHTGSEVYTITSTGVGSIVSATDTGAGAVTNINGSTPASGVYATNAATDATLQLYSVTLSSAVAGAQTINIVTTAATTGVPTTVATVTVTWGSPAGLSTGYSTAYIAQGGVLGTSTTNALGAKLSSAMTGGTTPVQAANITVTLKDANNVALASGASVSATVSGPGLLGITDTNATYTAAQTGRAVSLVALADNIFNVSVWSDGTAGTSTITISVGTTVLATKTVIFYGAPSTIKVVAQNLSIAKASSSGGTLGTAVAAPAGTSVATTPAVTLVAEDANGNAVPGLVITGVISDSTVLTSTSVVESDGNGAGDNYAGAGYYNASVTSAPAGVSGSKATVTYRTLLSDGVTYVSSAAVPFTLGGSAATGTFTMSLDSASYEPGSAAVLTVSGKDSKGNPIYDQDLNLWGGLGSAPVWSKSVQGSTPSGAAATTFVGGKHDYKMYAPALDGDFSVKGTLDSVTVLSGAVLTASATVSGTGSAAIDAANEATDAANAATDAANAAAEAADAATAAAQDAQAAVAALATQVSSLIAGIKAQITTLTNLVIKIQKKVRA